MASALTDWHGLPKWVSNWQKNATDDGIWMNNRKLIVPHQQIFKNILQMKSKIKVVMISEPFFFIIHFRSILHT